MPAKIDISLKEIYGSLCPKCQKRLKAMVEKKVASQLAKQSLEG